MPSQRKNVLIISYSPLHRDPRVLRQIQALKDEYNLTTIGLTNSGESKVTHFSFKEPVRHNLFGKLFHVLNIVFHRYEVILERIYGVSTIVTCDITVPSVIIANDWDGLYLAGKLIVAKKWASKVYFDAHEYEPKHFKSLMWKLFFKPLSCYVLKNYKKYISKMTTVCDGIAREYEKYLGFPKNSIGIITNAPMYEPDLSPTSIVLYSNGGGYA